jgi:4-amino-4-deoxy-L-arabinose transferase-like glycosyltransferase
MPFTNKNIAHIFILIALTYFFFMWGNGIISLTSPDEVFYTQTAKEMMQHHSWMTPYLFDAPQFEKPIFLYWLLRIAFAVYGVSSFGARFFPAVFAAIGVLGVYCFALFGFGDRRKAFISSLILASAGFYIGLARSVFTDMIFSVFVLLALLSFWVGYVRKDRKNLGICLFFVFAGAAVLTKGPLGLIIPLLAVSVFLGIKKELRHLFCKGLLWGIVLFVLTTFPWYVLMIQRYGNGFIHEFFINCHIRRLFEAEHVANDSWYFYPLTMVLGIFPWSLFTLGALVHLFRNASKKKEPLCLFLISWMIVTFSIFQAAHSKLASYIFPLFPVLALVTGDFIVDVYARKDKGRLLPVISWATFLLCLLFPIALFIALPKASHYLSSRVPVYILAGWWFVISIALALFIVQRRFLKGVYALTLLLPFSFCVVSLAKNDIDPYVSSKRIAEYLLGNYAVDNTIIVSKMFVRGVRYYTDKNVAVIDNTQFFSPHPIPFLDSDIKVRGFLSKQPRTFCILKTSSLAAMERLAGRDFKLTLVKKIGNEYLVRIEKTE